MYLRWITGLDSHAGWTTIQYRSGGSHLNADALSRINPGHRKHAVIYGPARGDCGFRQCVQCQNRGGVRKLLLDSDSDLSEDDDIQDVPIGSHKNETIQR